MFEDIFDPGIIASPEDLISFLRLWGLLFAAVFTLRLLQRIKNWLQRKSVQRKARREAKRRAKRA